MIRYPQSLTCFTLKESFENKTMSELDDFRKKYIFFNFLRNFNLFLQIHIV